MRFPFLHARMPAPTAALSLARSSGQHRSRMLRLDQADLFNFALGLFAYFWLYKEVAAVA